MGYVGSHKRKIYAILMRDIKFKNALESFLIRKSNC